MRREHDGQVEELLGREPSALGEEMLSRGHDGSAHGARRASVPGAPVATGVCS